MTSVLTLRRGLGTLPTGRDTNETLSRRIFRRVIFALALTLAVLSGGAAVADPVRAQASDPCPFVAVSDGCLYTNTGGDTSDPFDGFPVTNDGGIPFWDFYRQLEPQDAGYPISQRYVLNGLWVQAFQKVILQWQPASSSIHYLNTLDVLANQFPAESLPTVPPHQVLPAPPGASFQARVDLQLAILDQNPEIKRAFLAEPDWLNLFGLPISYAVFGDGAVEVLRAQRTVFAIWRVEAPGVSVGQVIRHNIPDKIKKLGDVIIPDHAKSPSRQPAIDEVLAHCPAAADIALVDAALDLRFEDDPTAGTLVCTVAEGSADLTRLQERTYHAVLLLRRFAFDAPLPWTDQALYDWFVGAIRGIRFDNDLSGFGYCCSPPRVMTINPLILPALQTQRWIGDEAGVRGMADFVRALVHEARHTHPAHRGHGCPDRTFDRTIAEMGAYGVEWHFINWLALHSDQAFLTDLDGAPYRDELLEDADFVRWARFCDEGVGTRSRGEVGLNEIVTGGFGPRTRVQWTFAGQADQVIRVSATFFDIVLTLFGPNGATVAQSEPDADLLVALPTTGTYVIQLHSEIESVGQYYLEISPGFIQ